MGGFPGRKTEGMNFQRMSPPRCLPARGSSPRPAAAAATASREGFREKGSCSPGGQGQRYTQLGEKLTTAWSHFCACGTRLAEEGTMRDQGGATFVFLEMEKINRGIRVKSKTGFRCLEEAAVGEFNLSKEGSKPTPHLISSHS